MWPLAVKISCEALSMVANTRRSLMAAMKLALLNGVPLGIRTPVRLV